MKLCCKVLAVATAALTLASAASAQTTLRYKYKQGEKVEYVIDQDQKMSMSVLGKDIDMKMNLAMDMTWQTLKVDEQGAAQVKVTFTQVKMAVDGPMGKVEINSKDKEAPGDVLGQKLHEVAQAIGGMEMTFTTDATGEMKDTKVSEEALKKLKDLAGGGGNLGGDMFSPDSMKQMLQNNLVLPKGAIEKGKSWTQKTDQKTPFGKIIGETKYTYEGDVQKDGRTLAKIAAKPDVKIEADPNAPVKITVKDSKGKGSLLFDNKLGRVLEGNNETTMQMEIDAGGMTITMNMVQNTTTRLKGASKKSSERPPPR